MKIYLLLFVCVYLTSCKPSLEIPQPSKGNCNLNNVMIIGGSYLAGLQNGALSNEHQQSSISALIINQMKMATPVAIKFPLLPPSLTLGLANNGLEWSTEMKLEFSKRSCDTVNNYIVQSDLLGNLVQIPNSEIEFYDRSKIASAQELNLSFPYCTSRYFIQNQNEINPGVGNPFFSCFVSDPSYGPLTFLKKVAAPSFSIISFGMDDILNAATSGMAYNNQSKFSLPSADSFEMFLDLLLKSSLRSSKQGVIATIPSIDYFPVFNLIPPQGVVLTAQKATDLNNLYGNTAALHFTEGANGFIAESETGTLTSLYPKKIKVLEANERVLLTVPIDSLKCYGLGVIKPIQDKYILDNSEISEIKTKLMQYNQIITSKANEYGLALVDLDNLFEEINTGIKLSGAPVTGDFVKGGFFSLDGFTTTNKGNAIIANEFLKAINLKYHSSFPTLDPNDYSGVKFP